jgi:class 3 adenylate cyclase
MPTKYDRFRMVTIIALVGGISLLHYTPVAGYFGMHILHRELYFIPILMGSFWFGIKMGLVTSLAVSLVYGLHFVFQGNVHSVSLAVSSQILMFILVAVILGWMVELQKRRQRERDFIKDTFGKYVDVSIRDKILNEGIPAGGELREVTVLFADLRDFSVLAETTPPRDVVKIINTYFGAMAEAIKANQGLVLQFIGDEIEAAFGAPFPLVNHSKSAVIAALHMRQSLSEVNQNLIAQGYPPLRHGIGIHTGPVLAGNIGSPDRLSYAMVGETVNLASRIQELNKKFDSDILISDATQKSLNNDVRLQKLPSETVKGKTESVDIFKVIDSA